jgi:hypothetical protein
MENLIVLDEIFRNFKSMEQGLSKAERLSKSLEIGNGMNLTKEEMFEMQTKIKYIQDIIKRMKAL